MFNVFCNDVESNFSIFEVALDTAIPNYEDIDISIRLNGELLEVIIYDNDVVDKQQVIEFGLSARDLAVRDGKRVPMCVL